MFTATTVLLLVAFVALVVAAFQARGMMSYIDKLEHQNLDLSVQHYTGTEGPQHHAVEELSRIVDRIALARNAVIAARECLDRKLEGRTASVPPYIAELINHINAARRALDTVFK